jgi:hypothetical protein
MPCRTCTCTHAHAHMHMHTHAHAHAHMRTRRQSSRWSIPPLRLRRLRTARSCQMAPVARSAASSASPRPNSSRSTCGRSTSHARYRARRRTRAPSTRTRSPKLGTRRPTRQADHRAPDASRCHDTASLQGATVAARTLGKAKARTSSVCAPSSGPAQRVPPGVPDSTGSSAGMVTRSPVRRSTTHCSLVASGE